MASPDACPSSEICNQTDSTAHHSLLYARTSRLEALPAELRNRIYDYCAEETIRIMHFDAFLRLRSAPRYIATYDPKQNWNIDTRTRYSQGLMQTSRLLRNEFRPLWSTQLNVNIYLPSVGAFIDTYLKGLESQCRGKLCVQIPNSQEEWLSLKPLMRLADMAPHLEIKFLNCAQWFATSFDVQDFFKRGRILAGAQSELRLQDVRVSYPVYASKRDGKSERLNHLKFVYAEEQRRRWMDGRNLWNPKPEAVFNDAWKSILSSIDATLDRHVVECWYSNCHTLWLVTAAVDGDDEAEKLDAEARRGMVEYLSAD